MKETKSINAALHKHKLRVHTLYITTRLLLLDNYLKTPIDMLKVAKESKPHCCLHCGLPCLSRCERVMGPLTLPGAETQHSSPGSGHALSGPCLSYHKRSAPAGRSPGWSHITEQHSLQSKQWGAAKPPLQ